MSDPLFYGKPLTFKPGSHRYYWDGQHLPSVTAIIGRLAKPAAHPVGRRLCGRAHPAPLACRSRRQPGNLCGAVRGSAQGAHAEARQRRRCRQDRASAGGRGAARQVRRHLGGAQQCCAAASKHALGALRQWLGATRMGAANLERRVMSRTHLYAGTTDRWGIIDGHHAVLDFKTGSGVYDEAWVECGGWSGRCERRAIAASRWGSVFSLATSAAGCARRVCGGEGGGGGAGVGVPRVARDGAPRPVEGLESAGVCSSAAWL